jgi:HEAT repeat protein
MRNLDAMRKLVVYPWTDPKIRDEGLQELGNPSSDEIVSMALEGLKSEDRNVRALVVKVLGYEGGEKAAQGILQALNDPKRRVRESAADWSQKFLNNAEVVKKLNDMVEDESEKNKIRRKALQSLGGGWLWKEPVKELPRPAVKSLAVFSKLDRYRTKVLSLLVNLELTDEVKDLLNQFVKDGTREEAVMATRALCGYRIVNLGSIEDEEEKKKIVQTCEMAGRKGFYWIMRE